MSDKHTKKHKIFRGVVVSDKMQKTIVVRVDRIKEHPKYERRYRVSKRYKAHDEKGEFRTGDIVLIEEVRPLSRDKRWRAVKKIGENRTEVLEANPKDDPSNSE
ncbi:MAG: 30S ribosomal protein S17 [bacterium]|nr:30S ribosomal protein S17 [bacterium]